MKKLFILLSLTILPLLSYSQIVKTNEIFENVYTFDGKVVFIKQIQPTSNSLDRNYLALKEWARINFAKDPFNSSINYNDKDKKITAQSRIELLLPENEKGIREKIIMKYRLNGFFDGNLCVMEISNISFINDSKANENTLQQKIKAEDMITDRAILINDTNKETRMNIRKNTLYFFNDLVSSLQRVLNK